jgi:DNA-binding MarR family transcriptional regulator
MSETAALARLDREGPTTSSALAKLEQITPQSMGVILSALESRGLIARRADPNDGRRIVMSLTRAGRDCVLRRRDASTESSPARWQATSALPKLGSCALQRP